MAQSNATIYIKPNTLTSLNVVAITDEGTLNLSLSDFVQSSIPSGVYLAYTASDFNRIKSVTVSSPGYKTATWSTTDTHLTDVYVTLEEAPNPAIREISVGGVVYDIDAKGISDITAQVAQLNTQVGENTTQISDLRNMSNITATGKETVVGWCMPDYSAGISISNGFVAPKDGVIVVAFNWTQGNWKASLNGFSFVASNNASGAGQQSSGFCIAPTGSTFTTNGSGTFTFFPLKGVK